MDTLPFYLDLSNMKGTIIASKVFFESEAVLSALGKYTPHYHISVCPYQECDIMITIEDKENNILTERFLRDIMNELLDQQIRINTQRTFADLRRAIVKHAFEPVSF